MKPNVQTPWGAADYSKAVAPGITWYSTPGHGGYHVDDEQNAKIKALFPNAKIWAGNGWYEEDCDWALVALAFPELFEAPEIRAALRTVQGREDAPTIGLHFSMLKARVKAWEDLHFWEWERGSMGSAPDGYGRGCWHVWFRRVGDGAQQDLVVAPYPENVFWTDKDIENGRHMANLARTTELVS